MLTRDQTKISSAERAVRAGGMLADARSGVVR
jgi:hypothetical protein